MRSNQIVGRRGEQIAASYLESKGYRILAQNLRTPYGEIDLIAEYPLAPADLVEHPARRIVFVEVKTRRTKSFGPPEEAITPRKQAHLLAAIHHYMQQNPAIEAEWRLDVIAIENFPSEQAMTITHFENALTD